MYRFFKENQLTCDNSIKCTALRHIVLLVWLENVSIIHTKCNDSVAIYLTALKPFECEKTNIKLNVHNVKTDYQVNCLITIKKIGTY